MPVYLVGAGPGDPELMTLKGRRLLETADVVFYDELANPALLDLAPPGAERVYVGKRAHHHSIPQEEIAAWMIERARRGLQVVRLKGGDPFVFGRGGEEAEALSRAGIAWEAVPGVSSGTGAATVAGIPLTHRGIATSVRFVTGHSAFSQIDEQDSAGETLVIFMGLERLEAIAEELMIEGRSRSTPVAVIERGTLPDERVVTGDLGDIAVRARAAGARPPALVIVGDVVRLRQKLAEATAAGLEPPAEFLEKPEAQPGIVLLAHGSPVRAWHTSVERMARDLAVSGQFTTEAYLPPARPSLSEAVEKAVDSGLKALVVVPYFLAAGLHVTRDIPQLVEAERQRFPHLRIETSDCLEGHPALRTAVLGRAGEALAAMRPDRGKSSTVALCSTHEVPCATVGPGIRRG